MRLLTVALLTLSFNAVAVDCVDMDAVNDLFRKETVTQSEMGMFHAALSCEAYEGLVSDGSITQAVADTLINKTNDDFMHYAKLASVLDVIAPEPADTLGPKFSDPTNIAMVQRGWSKASLIDVMGKPMEINHYGNLRQYVYRGVSEYSHNYVYVTRGGTVTSTQYTELP